MIILSASQSWFKSILTQFACVSRHFDKISKSNRTTGQAPAPPKHLTDHNTDIFQDTNMTFCTEVDLTSSCISFAKFIDSNNKGSMQK